MFEEIIKNRRKNANGQHSNQAFFRQKSTNPLLENHYSNIEVILKNKQRK